jgi:hypothetical protein
MNFNCTFTESTESESSLLVRAMMKPQKEKDTHMKKFSALMIGAAMILGTAFAAQEAAKAPEKTATTATTKKVSKKHSKTSKKSAKKTAASTAVTTPAPAPAK